MNEFIAGYQTLTSTVVGGIQKIGLLSIPLGIAIAVIVNYFGGERAIRAVGLGIAVIALFTLILNNAVALGNWIGAPSAIASTAATPVPHP
jgi:hypothetical protein